MHFLCNYVINADQRRLYLGSSCSREPIQNVDNTIYFCRSTFLKVYNGKIYQCYHIFWKRNYYAFGPLDTWREYWHYLLSYVDFQNAERVWMCKCEVKGNSRVWVQHSLMPGHQVRRGTRSRLWVGRKRRSAVSEEVTAGGQRDRWWPGATGACGELQ